MITIEEPEEQTKDRLKDLTKAEIIKHYIREKVELVCPVTVECTNLNSNLVAPNSKPSDQEECNTGR